MKPDIQLIINYLETNLTSARYKHTMGTRRIALELAKKHNVSRDKAEIASLLHDSGKWMDSDALVKYTQKAKLRVPHLKDIIVHNPSLLHSFVSADIAKKRFGVRDKDILTSISLHTTAGKNMSALAKIVYLADITAPDRRFPNVDKLRRLAARDLDKAMLVALSSKISYVLKKDAWLHPWAVEAYNWLK